MSEFSINDVLWHFAKENKSTLITYFVLSLAFPINDVILPYYYGQVIDQATSSTKKDIWKNTQRSITIIASLWVIKQFLINRLDSLDAVFLPKLQSYIRKAVVCRILNVYAENYRDPEIGRLMTHITKLPFIVRDLFHQVRYFVIPVVLVVIFTLGYLFYVHPSLGGIYLAGIGGFLGLILWFCKSCFKLSDRKEKVHTQLNEEITDLLVNMLNVYSGDTQEEEIIRLEKHQEDLDKKYKEAIECASNFKTIFNIAYMFIFASINGYAFYLYSKGKITIGSLSSVLIVTLFVIGMLESASREIRDFAANIGVLHRAQKAINELGLASIYTNPANFHAGDILIDNLSVFRSGKKVLFIPKLYIRDGEVVTIIGKTGCGKSTLAQALVKLIPYKGTIKIGGKDIKNIWSQNLRKHIAYVPQQPRLFNRSILENISYGSTASKEDIVTVLRELDISQIDLDRPAGKHGNNLSGGQKQIVYFLRFLFRTGKIIILDEPTASLDSSSRDQVLRILKRMIQGKTTIIITHDPK